MAADDGELSTQRRLAAFVQQIEGWQQAGVTDVSAAFFEKAVASWGNHERVGAVPAQKAPPSAPAASPSTSGLQPRAGGGYQTQQAGPAGPLHRSAAPKPNELAPLVGELVEPYPAPVPGPQRPGMLQVLASEVAACTRCAELARTRTQTVFGVGSHQPRLCFLGEAPGADEDRQGEPFVGAAGQLLNKILAACKLERGEVYILNVLKCRPPGNRTPSDTEMSHCWHFARRQLEILQPEYICCLGAVAVRGLLQTKMPLGKLRGQFHQYRGSRVVVTYHPAYLLRNPNAKYQTWDDMKMLMKAMGVEL